MVPYLLLGVALSIWYCQCSRETCRGDESHVVQCAAPNQSNRKDIVDGKTRGQNHIQKLIITVFCVGSSEREGGRGDIKSVNTARACKERRIIASGGYAGRTCGEECAQTPIEIRRAAESYLTPAPYRGLNFSSASNIYLT